LSDRSVGFAEIWSKEDIEEGASKAFDCVGDGEDSNAFSLKVRLASRMRAEWEVAADIFDVRTWVDGDNVAMLDAKIVSDNTVDARTTVIEIIVCKHDQDCIFSLLALDKHCVSAEEL
jgi:hypothetical protein